MLTLENHVVSFKGRARGVLLPSTFFGRTPDGQDQVWGPQGVKAIHERADEGLLDALVASGALLPGSDNAIAAAAELLRGDSTSRNASFLSCNAASCDDLVNQAKVIGSVRLLVVGCGGIGSNAAMVLAGAGVKHFDLADDDVIALSNLNRQLFWTKRDVGRNKTDVLAAAIHARFDECAINTIEVKATENWLLQHAGAYDAVLISGDEPETLVSSGARVAQRCRVHVLGGGYMHHQAGFLYFPPGCAGIADAQTSVEWRRGPNAIMPSYGPTNILLASMMASHLVQALRQPDKHRRPRSFTWDAARLSWAEIDNDTLHDATTVPSRAEDVAKLSYPALVGLLHQENTPPGASKTLASWIASTGIDSHSMVLDLACSTGYSSRNVSAITRCSGLGIDVEPAAIASAKRLAARDGLDTLEFRVADACNLPAGAGTFTHVLAGCTFAFFRDQQGALREVRRVLKDQGTLCVANFSYSTPPPAEVLDLMERHVGFRPSAQWTESWWKRFFESEGFALVSENVEQLSPRDERVVQAEVHQLVHGGSHAFSDGDDELKEAVFQKLLAMRFASNLQRRYQALSVQAWRKI